MSKTYPQRIFKCKQLSIVGLKVKCAPEQAQATYLRRPARTNKSMAITNKSVTTLGNQV